MKKKNYPMHPKRCTNCGVTKGPECFQYTRFDTLSSWCNDCKNAASLALWHKRKERNLTK